MPACLSVPRPDPLKETPSENCRHEAEENQQILNNNNNNEDF